MAKIITPTGIKGGSESTSIMWCSFSFTENRNNHSSSGRIPRIIMGVRMRK